MKYWQIIADKLGAAAGHVAIAAPLHRMDGSALVGGGSTGVPAGASSPPTMTLTINDLVIGQLHLVQFWANESLGLVQELGLKSDILTAPSEPNHSVSVSVALLLLGMGSVTPLGPATVALSEIESVADALMVPVAL